MERARGSERRSALLNWKPLADLTNALAHPLRKSKPQLTPAPDIHSIPVRSRSSMGYGKKPGDTRIPTTTLRGKEITRGCVGDGVKHDRSKHCTLHMQHSIEETKDKGRAVTVSEVLSCPPLERTRGMGHVFFMSWIVALSFSLVIMLWEPLKFLKYG